MTTLVPANEVVDAALVDDEGLVPSVAPTEGPLIDHNTVLRPGEEIPTEEKGPRYTDRDLYVSEETARAMDEAGVDESGPRGSAMRGP
ncbi:hypothetical protein [Streptomyces benahoarensis]|uniref:Uncharacterized protein n=1 Tax=Streptomyces benahoarensis TaxID=2595054 RepID=A0A553ZDP1_9ACTN|nr:hypothetical protein [Streptomyces benahoarensis]TSB25115.1 hypothetical protein FNJ62_13340 [Streptomyces benahoarensis]TSB39551.1 hypothetical protein FNZ23_15335 [Streptomyces benahoarensis]